MGLFYIDIVGAVKVIRFNLGALNKRFNRENLKKKKLILQNFTVALILCQSNKN